MRTLRVVATGILACCCAGQAAGAKNVMKPVALPSAEQRLVGAAFSPDSKNVAIIRNVDNPRSSERRYVLQIVELKSAKELAHADVLNTEPDLAMNAQFAEYSADGHYLLLAVGGADVLSIIDVTTLRTVRQIALHPKADSRVPLGPGHPYFRGIVSVAASSKGDVFGVLTHDELNSSNEAFIGSFSSGQIINNWSLGKGRAVTQLGQISISLSEDGSTTAVSVLPDQNTLPKNFNNLRYYNSSNGELIRSFRTNGLVGQIAFVSSDNLLAARIDTPGFFAKKTCIERWNLNSGSLSGQFCDRGRDTSGALGAAPAAHFVVGFASQLHKSIEGQVYAASGRVDVWDLTSASLIASSDEIPRFVSSIQISANGEWVLADQMLLHLDTAP